MTDRVRAILFDAGGTLYRITDSRAARFARALGTEGYMVGNTALTRAVQSADLAFDWPEYPQVRTVDDEQTVWTAYCRFVSEALGLPVHPDLVGRLTTACSHLTCLELYPDTLPALDYWRGRAHLALLSNNVPSCRVALDQLGLTSYFSECVISCEVGLWKPDPAIYELALRRLGLPASSVCFVDDARENVQVAIDIGMGAPWICRDEQRDGPGPLSSAP